ncbi:MAG: membrane protein insertase YidC [Candidatus Acidulodesulfobacterium ferriphilum]|uniref:Membrane protein insertase YidC n=1 Tax=Candidatus Acidulodesulfobacterium ferriphilum TaxID=2597223 RepID=A0A519BDN1_9DELT|nr:MAG: membrane protein insertase YidC [Candidatus Acidulodesulfobacterium ferriphilum]
MEKRIIIASILSVILILAWGYLMPHTGQNKAAVTKPGATSSKITQAQTKEPVVEKNAPSKSKKLIAVSKSVQSIKSVSYKGDKIYAMFNIPDGAVSKLNLLNYSYTEKNLENKVNLANTQKTAQIINFIPQNAQSSLKLVNIKKEKDSIKFFYDINNKIILVKDYKFLNGKYLLTNDISIKNLTNKPIIFKGHYVLSATLKPVSKNLNYINFSPVIYINKGSVTPDTTQTTKYKGDISFAGFNSKYFMLAAVSPGNTVSVKKTGEIISFIIPKTVLVSPKKTADISLNVYGGPKKLSLLTPLGHSLNSTLDFGFFGFFSIILLHVLEFFYGFVHNYGLAIILLVLAIRIVFYPLTYTGFKSMKQMQKLTPKINELRERYKDNKTELNKKIMELYKESRVNPFGGCLPMILQIPVFYGLYMTLLMSIQLRNAPFVFWIHNLSIQDPYYILPVLMGLTMLISQKMNPVIGDPTQAKIMLILPIVFTFVFIHFPAGLLLYWTVNNILTIAQQYIINRKFA